MQQDATAVKFSGILLHQAKYKESLFPELDPGVFFVVVSLEHRLQWNEQCVTIAVCILINNELRYSCAVQKVTTKKETKQGSPKSYM